MVSPSLVPASVWKAKERSGNRFRQVEEVCVLRLAEVERVVEFLQHDQLGTLRCNLADVVCEIQFVLFDVGGAALLHDAYFQKSFFFHGAGDVKS